MKISGGCISSALKHWSFKFRPTISFPQIPIFILFTTLITIMALLFLNAALKKRDEFLENLENEDYEGASQDHPDLIAYIRQLHIQQPLPVGYKLQNPQNLDTSQNRQATVVAGIFGNKTKGTFIEAGAYDGEDFSNTLYLERHLNWTGLLVEPDPWNYWSLRKKGRKSSAIRSCISPTTFSMEVSFKQSDTMGRIVDVDEVNKGKGIFTRVKCFPLFSLLLAQNLTTVDFLSLDVEGKELEILKTLPWNKIRISVICVEHKHIPGGGLVLKEYLEEKDYRLQMALGDDYIFVKNSIAMEKFNVGILNLFKLTDP